MTIRLVAQVRCKSQVQTYDKKKISHKPVTVNTACFNCPYDDCKTRDFKLCDYAQREGQNVKY